MTQLEHFKISDIEELKIFLVKYGPLIKKNTHFFTSSLSSLTSLNKKSRENTLSQIPNYKEILDYLIKKDEIIIINIQQNIQFYILKTIEDLFLERLRILKIDIQKILKNENFIKRKLLIDRLKNSGYQYNKNRFFIEILSWMKKDNILDVDKIYLTHYIFLPENKQIFIDYRRDMYNKNSKALQKKRRMAQFFDERLFSKLDFSEKEINEYVNFMLILEEKDLFKGRSIEKMRKSALWVILKKNGKVLNGGINQFCEEIDINKKDLFSYLSIISQNVAILEKSFSNKEIIKNLINSVMKYFGTQNRYVFIWALTILKELFKTNKTKTRRGLNTLNAAIIYGIYYFLKDLNLLSKNEKITQNILCRDFRCSEVSLRKEVKLIERIINNKTESLKKSISNPHLKGSVYFLGYIKSLISPFITENEGQEMYSVLKRSLTLKDKNHENNSIIDDSKEDRQVVALNKRSLKELNNFLKNNLRMNHIYQPFIIKTLLINNGVSNIDKVAEELAFQLNGDIKYYRKRILVAPKDVLTYHNIVQFKQDGTMKLLFELNNQSLVREIIELCNKRIEDYSKNKNLNIYRIDLDHKQHEPLLNNFDFSQFKNFKYHSALNCFLVDKWYKISPTQGVSKYTSMDYWINFYKHYNLNYKVLETEKTHRLQLMILFSGKMVKSDSIDYNRQVRQFGCNFKYAQGIWNVGYNAKGEIKLTANYLGFIKNLILMGQKIRLLPLLKIIYHNRNLNDLELHISFIKEFNINREEIEHLFFIENNVISEMEYFFNNSIKNTSETNLSISETIKPSSNNLLSMKNQISQEFMKVIKSGSIMGPSQFKKEHIQFFIDFYKEHFSKELFSEEELENFYLPQYFSVEKIQGIPLIDYLNDFRYGRMQFFQRDSKTYKYKMSNLTKFIDSINIISKDKTFLHLIIRIPHFLVFCILFAYSSFVLKSKGNIQFFKKNHMKLDIDQHFLTIYTSVYTAAPEVGRLAKYYFNMLEWLESLEFTNNTDNRITPSQKLKNFIYGDLSGDFSLPNKISRIIEEAIDEIEV